MRARVPDARPVTTAAAALAAAMVTLVGAAVRPQPHDGRPLAFLSSLNLRDDDIRDLHAGGIVVRTLDARDAAHFVIFAAARIDVTPEQFTRRVSDAARLWRGVGVPATGTFATPARAEDVDRMSMPPEDLRALRRCQPGDCDVKLSERQMHRIRTAIDRQPTEWRAAALQAFRSSLLDRVAVYRREGLAGLAVVHDHRTAVDPHSVFMDLLASAGFARAGAPALIEYLARYPDLRLPRGAAEHMYWLIERIDGPGGAAASP